MKFIKRLIISLMIIIILIVSVIIFWGYNMYKDAIQEVSVSSKVETIRNSPNYTKLIDTSPDFKNAIIAVEDHRFYKHSGIDIITTTRSMINNISQKDIIAGGSTITQQIGRIMYFTQEQRFTRKVAELFVAFDLEDKYEKDDILELYINKIYYGNGYHGIYEASMGYYNKLPKDLTLDEASMLAGIPNAPSVYAPTKNPKLAAQRARQVINKMVECKYLSKEEADKIIQENQSNI